MILPRIFTSVQNQQQEIFIPQWPELAIILSIYSYQDYGDSLTQFSKRARA